MRRSPRTGFVITAVGCLLVMIYNSGGRSSRVGTLAGCLFILVGFLRLWRDRRGA